MDKFYEMKKINSVFVCEVIYRWRFEILSQKGVIGLRPNF